MDCREVVVKIASYIAEGYKREGFGFFTKPYEELSDRLRVDYFDKERAKGDYFREGAPERPRTPTFINAVKFECMCDASNGGGFVFFVNGTGIEDPNDIVGRALNKLCRIGYRHLIDGDGKK